MNPTPTSKPGRDGNEIRMSCVANLFGLDHVVPTSTSNLTSSPPGHDRDPFLLVHFSEGPREGVLSKRSAARPSRALPPPTSVDSPKIPEKAPHFFYPKGLTTSGTGYESRFYFCDPRCLQGTQGTSLTTEGRGPKATWGIRLHLAGYVCLTGPAGEQVEIWRLGGASKDT